jgi:hypothetical protein
MELGAYLSCVLHMHGWTRFAYSRLRGVLREFLLFLSRDGNGVYMDGSGTPSNMVGLDEQGGGASYHLQLLFIFR